MMDFIYIGLAGILAAAIFLGGYYYGRSDQRKIDKADKFLKDVQKNELTK